MNKLVLLTPDELKELIRNEIVLAIKTQQKELTKTDPVLDRQGVAKMFMVTLPTIHAWMNQSKIPFYRLGGRVYFRQSELLNAVKKVTLHKGRMG